MSGFSPEWLALREPADLAARNRDVLASCARAFADRDSVNVCDMGAGTGASVRAISALLPRRQVWTLIDSDEKNLAAALEQLARWGADARAADGGLSLRKDDRQLHVRTRVLDLATIPACWPKDTELLTASALFDLTSAHWLGELVAALAAHKLPLLSMLTFDGAIVTTPAHPLDDAIAEAFRNHQQRDKGFGPAAGPHAAEALESALNATGYEIASGDSPWVIEGSAPALLQETLAGIATAAREMNSMPSEDVERWLRACLTSTRVLTIGHRDVFARPKAP